MATPMCALRVRSPAVDGRFYEASPERLRREVEGYLAAADLSVDPSVDAVVAPHAGYLYSGPVAASALGVFAASRSRIARVVVIGPSHRVPLRGLALPGADAFDTPLGRIEIDGEGTRAVAGLPQVTVDPSAHVGEHSIEVELPFLQVVLGEFRLVPLVVGRASAEEVGEVLKELWNETDCVVVASSDLSHDHSYEEARRRDRRTATRIGALDATLEPQDACGWAAVNGLLLAARDSGRVARVVDLRSSGDTAGDRDRVVGYAAVHLHRAA